jgi:hypothetical protein
MLRFPKTSETKLISFPNRKMKRENSYSGPEDNQEEVPLSTTPKSHEEEKEQEDVAHHTSKRKRLQQSAPVPTDDINYHANEEEEEEEEEVDEECHDTLEFLPTALDVMGENFFDMTPREVIRIDWWNKGKESNESIEFIMPNERVGLLYCIQRARKTDPQGFRNVFVDIDDHKEMLSYETHELRLILAKYHSSLEGATRGTIRKVVPTRYPSASSESVLQYLMK